MKRQQSVALVVAAAALMIGGCGGQPVEPPVVHTVDMAEVATLPVFEAAATEPVFQAADTSMWDIATPPPTLEILPGLPGIACLPDDLVAPIPIHPSQDMVGSGVDTFFQWDYPQDCQPTHFAIHICGDGDCSQVFASAYPGPDLRSWTHYTLLEPGSTLFWRIRAYALDGDVELGGPWSPTVRFFIGDECGANSMTAPVLSSPGEGETVDAIESLEGHRPTLEWTVTGGCQPEEFQVEVTTDAFFRTINISHRTGSPVSAWYVDQDLRGDEYYHWRVAAVSNGGLGPYSEPRGFYARNVTPGQPGAVVGRVWSDVCPESGPWGADTPIPEGCTHGEGNWIIADGELGPGEAGIQGVVVSYAASACPPSGTAHSTMPTSSDGTYVAYVPAGAYCVWLDPVAGGNADILGEGIITAPPCYYSGMEPCTVIVGDGQILQGNNFGWQFAGEAASLGSIGGRVWSDTDSDGTADPNEPGIASVTVRLFHDACTFEGDSSAVVAAGDYLFEGLPAGEYCVTIDAAESGNAASLDVGVWTRPWTGDSRAAFPVSLGVGEARGGVDFGWDWHGFHFERRSTPFYLGWLELIRAATLPEFQTMQTRTPTPTSRFHLLPATHPPFQLPATPAFHVATATPRPFLPLPTAPPFIPGS